jgi:hypothetical protein
MRQVVPIVLAALAANAFPASARTFLLTELEVKDPHVFADLPLFGCTDVTNVVPLSPGNSFNEVVAEDLVADDNNDGFLDFAPIIVFLDPQSVTTSVGAGEGGFEIDPTDPGGEAAFHFAHCSFPRETTVCTRDLEVPVDYSDYTNGISGTCLSPIPGTTSGYDPAIVTPQAPCFVSDPFPMLLRFIGLHVPLEHTEVAATYEAPFELIEGLISGFLTESVADSIVFDETVPLVGGQTLSSLLPGGTESCTPLDDLDLGPDGQTPGWWIYMNFRAVNVSLISTSIGGSAPAVPVSAGVRLESGVPNPFRSETTFTYAVPRPGSVRLRVVDVAGRLVRELVDSPMVAGVHTASWTGVTTDGRPVTPGIYFVRLDTPDGSRTRRVTHLR